MFGPNYCFYDQADQGGIDTPPKRCAVSISFSLAAGAERADLQALLARWSAAAAVLQQGKPVSPYGVDGLRLRVSDLAGPTAAN
jgi:deferrochelatase/peroxidase EfeB